MGKKKTCQINPVFHAGNVPLIATIIVLIAFVAGLMTGTLVTVKAYNKSFIGPTGSFAQGYEAARKKLIDSGFFGDGQANSLNGQVSRVAGREITFNTSLLNPLDDESLKTRTAVAGDDTEIILYRLKTAEKAAADRKAAQAEIKNLQGQQKILQNKMNNCTGGPASMEGGNCETAHKEYSDLMNKIDEAYGKMDLFERVDNASLNDIKSGMQIIVYSQKTQEGEDKNAVSPYANFEDIYAKTKFNISKVEVREARALPGATE